MPSSSNKGTPRPKRLTASANTPWLGVHVITEFMFCSRAGLIAYELGQEDDDEYYEELQPNLQYLPCYDLSQIEERLNWIAEEMKRRLRTCVVTSLVVLSLLAVIASISRLSFNSFLAIAIVLLVCLLIWGFTAVGTLRPSLEILQRRYAAATSAIPQEPAESTDNESVNWWDLLAAGFESVVYREPLRDPKLRVAGRPWRVLRKGSLRIPVWRRRGENAADRDLRRQHYARMAAYCHLIEQAEGGRSPYGVVLLGENEYEGITVSNGRGSNTAFHKGLRKARSVVSEAQSGNEPYPPDSRRCWNCPKGKPYSYREGISDARTGRLNSPVNLQRSLLDDRNYHSECGDRFCWLPPHQRATEKDLS